MVDALMVLSSWLGGALGSKRSVGTGAPGHGSRVTTVPCTGGLSWRSLVELATSSISTFQNPGTYLTGGGCVLEGGYLTGACSPLSPVCGTNFVRSALLMPLGISSPASHALTSKAAHIQAAHSGKAFFFFFETDTMR